LNFKKDYYIWLSIVLLTISASYLTYNLTIPTPVKIIIWIVWTLSFFVLAYFTTLGKTVYGFANESKLELQKVVWPSRQETVQTTTIVMIMVSVTGFILWAIDSFMMSIIAKITHLG
jgi:preprotein translocase subunit SecE